MTTRLSHAEWFALISSLHTIERGYKWKEIVTMKSGEFVLKIGQFHNNEETGCEIWDCVINSASPQNTAERMRNLDFIFPGIYSYGGILCQYLSKVINKEIKSLTLFFSSIIELGCGLGLAGLLCCKLGATVHFTDRNHILPLVKRNLELNQIESSQAHLSTLNWGEDLSQELSSVLFDVILGAELLYEEKNFDVLLKSILSLSNPKTLLLMCFTSRGLHEEKFISALEKHYSIEITIILPQANEDLHGLYGYSDRKSSETSSQRFPTGSFVMLKGTKQIEKQT